MQYPVGWLYHQKKSPYWWAKIVPYKGASAIYESTKRTQKNYAKTWLKDRLKDFEMNLGNVKPERVTFDELCEDIRTDYRIRGKKSPDRLDRSIKNLQKIFSGMLANQINTARVNRYIDLRQNEGASNATINRELSALKRMFNLGAQCTPKKVIDVPHVPKLREANPRKGFFEHGDFLALRDALPDHLKGFVTFAYKTGWRVSEITGLTWSQVDLARGTVRLEAGTTKNDEGRTVYLDDELKGIFASQKAIMRQKGALSPYVFPNRKGTGRIKDFRGSWESACKRAGIGKKLFHDFRRTAVRNMIRAGIPERVAMMISGHKTRSVFDRYNIVDDKDLRQAAERIAAYHEKSVIPSVIPKIFTLHQKSKINVQPVDF